MSNENEVLTDKETAALFNQASQALRDNDTVKMSEIMEKPVSTEETPATEDKPGESPEEDKSKETPDETDGDKTIPEGDKKEEDKTDPLTKADQTDKTEDDKKEPTELDKLKEQLEKLAKENHGLRSQVGRLPHVQRKIKELDKKLEELDKQKSSPSSQPSAKIKPRVEQLLKNISETDADLAKAIADAIAEATDGVANEQLAKERDHIEFLRKQEINSYQDAEAERLLEMVPNAPEIFAHDAWKEWKASQPAWVNRLADSDSADEVMEAINRYATDMSVKYPELAKSKEEVITPPAASNEAAEQAKRVEAERARKKETSVNITNPTAAGKVGLPNDDLALFNKFVGEINKQRTG